VTHAYHSARICDPLLGIFVCVGGILAGGSVLLPGIDRYPDLFVFGLTGFPASSCSQDNMSFAYQGLNDGDDTTYGKWSIVYVDSSGFSASQ
jgi:hypothetical protein